MKSLNPLSLLGSRKVEILPPYFETVKSDNLSHMAYYEDWIEQNLKGRYFIAKRRIPNGQYRTLVIGFENPKELSHFILAGLDTLVK